MLSSKLIHRVQHNLCIGGGSLAAQSKGTCPLGQSLRVLTTRIQNVSKNMS